MSRDASEVALARADGLVNFSPVMASGILSLAAGSEAEPLLSRALLAVAVIQFAGIAIVDVHRLASEPRRVVAWLRTPGHAIELFTIVAAGVVVGQDLDFPALMRCLLIASLGVAVVAAILTLGAMAGRSGRSARVVTGTWFLAVVAAQSLAIAAASPWLWLLGLLLYATLIGPLTRGALSRRPDLDWFTPDHWIVMGALAISTVAGLHLSGSGPGSSVIAAATLGIWVLATLLIPALVTLEAARSIARPELLVTEPGRWAMVFPLGMYSLATHGIGVADGGPALGAEARAFLWIGLAAWLGVMAARAARLRLPAPARGRCEAANSRPSGAVPDWTGSQRDAALPDRRARDR